MCIHKQAFCLPLIWGKGETLWNTGYKIKINYWFQPAAMKNKNKIMCSVFKYSRALIAKCLIPSIMSNLES